MKKFSLFLISVLALTGASLGLVGCAGGEVGVDVDSGPYYGDGPWAYGPGWHDGGGGFRGGWGGGRHR